MRNIALVLIAAAVAGCGELRWTRPGADPNVLARDQANCRASASEGVMRRYGPPAPTQRPDVKFGPETSIPGAADRQLLEQQAFDRCMREKGYALVRNGA